MDNDNMRKVVGIGETVLDIIFRNDQPVKAVPGGSVYNSLVSLGRTGVKAMMISETGNDRVGRRIIGFLEENGVDASCVMTCQGARSPLSLAFLNEKNDAEYLFYKDHQNDRISFTFPPLGPGDMVLFGSYYAVNPVIRLQVKVFLEYARQCGALLYYDVNFRASHRDELPLLLPAIEENFRLADVVRGSDEDFTIMFGTGDAEEIARSHIPENVAAFIMTRGAQPVQLLGRGARRLSFAVEPTETVSTIGAGDNFNAGFLFGLLSQGVTRAGLQSGLDDPTWQKVAGCALSFSANVCRSIDNYVDHGFASQWRRKLSALLLMLLMPLLVAAQLTGVVLDAADGAPVPYASVVYKGNNVAAKCDGQGRFSIERHNGWRLTFSSVGYSEQVVNVASHTPRQLTIRLSAAESTLREVTVKSKRKSRYRRKDNPAVELMRKVIAHKKRADLKHHDYYSYENYQKIMLGLNDLSPELLEKGLFKRYPWLKEQVETSQYTDKQVLPLTVDEMVTQHIYRKEPRMERTIVKGTKASGVNDLFQTGDILTQVMREVFADVDIYDDYLLLLRHKFSSPIGRDAIQFYRYYITDTVYVGQDRCIHLDFVPNNQQDFGFRGQLYVLCDSTYQVKRCELGLPGQTDVNWVEGLQIMQEFAQQDDGQWVLTIDDMIAELMVTDFITKAVVTRTTRLSDFSFNRLEDISYKGSAPQIVERGSDRRDDSFWEQHRQVEFTKSERGMGNFLSHIEQLKGYCYAIFVLKALFENYLETGTRENPNKVDVGPINTFISQNFYDGLRLRFGGQTTANLNPHLFAKGYFAYGTETHQNYYNAELTYSLNEKQYLPQEFPIRAVTLQAGRDVALPSDKFSQTDKDNIFASFKVHDIDKMFMYETQKVAFDYETLSHLKMSLSLKHEQLSPIGNIFFERLSDRQGISPMKYSEATFGLRYAPNEKFVNTKQRRRVMNQDAWYASASHTVGISGLLGGQYDYHFSEFELYRRNWLPMSWGRIDARLRGAWQWSEVPFPLLAMPQANQSYIIDYRQFNLMNNMELLTDRNLTLMLTWEMGGKLLNRIPLLRKLKWREVAELKTMWGSLSRKNNPFLAENQQKGGLFLFPTGSYPIDSHRPYMEYAVGIQNIFNLIQIEYVRRLNYLWLPTAEKHGIRFVINPTF